MSRLLLVAVLGPLSVVAAPAEKLSPARLADLFLTNEAAADEQFVGQVVEVTGQVVRVSRSPHQPGQGGPNYVLELDQGKAGRGDRVDVRIFFEFGRDSRGELAKLKPGQTVVARGRCDHRRVWLAQPGKADREYSEVYVEDCGFVAER